jgi:hypothetical protein
VAGAAPTQQAAAAVRRDVARLLAGGETVGHLMAAAVDMAHSNPRFRSLGKHLEHYAPVQRASARERCPDHPRRYRTACLDGARAEPPCPPGVARPHRPGTPHESPERLTEQETTSVHHRSPAAPQRSRRRA